jgi:hypothetical protein
MHWSAIVLTLQRSTAPTVKATFRGMLSALLLGSHYGLTIPGTCPQAAEPSA